MLRDFVTTRAEFGEQLALHLMSARSATSAQDTGPLEQETERALALLDPGQAGMNALEEAYLSVVRDAVRVARRAARDNRWQLAEDAIDAVHNVGELFRGRVQWRHEFFLDAFIDVFVKKWGKDAASVRASADLLALQLRVA